jgi:hypothetical protein
MFLTLDYHPLMNSIMFHCNYYIITKLLVFFFITTGTLVRVHTDSMNTKKCKKE